MTTATVYGDDYEPFQDPAYVAQLERDLLAYEQATRTDPHSRQFDAWVDAMEQDIAAKRICACGNGPVVYDGMCDQCTRWAYSKFSFPDPSMICELAELQGGFDRPSAFDEHGGIAE